MAQENLSPLTIPLIKAKKVAGERIVAITAYDFPIARLADEAGVDIILVGDSLGMVVLGYENTLPVTMEEMLHHTRAVARAVKRALLVADMPYFSFHLSPDETIRNAARFIKEAGAKAVKIEGATSRRLAVIEALVEAEIPVMGHVGLTPQSINRLGQYRLQGSEWEEAKKIVDEARELEKRGCFSIVLECVPEELGKIITNEVRIPTIGIGSGRFCNGQILVFHDLMGLTEGNLPKFVKKYADLAGIIRKALQNYAYEVKEGIYPDPEHAYHVQMEKLKLSSALKMRTKRVAGKRNNWDEADQIND